MRNFAKRLFRRMCALLVIPVLLSLSSTAMAQSIPPELSELHHAWQSHFWAGRNTEALGALHEMLDRAREGSPESAWVYSEIADIYLYRLRDASQARTNYEMALGIFRNLAKNGGNKRYPAECSTLFNIRMIDFARAKVIDASQFEEAIDRLVPYAEQGLNCQEAVYSDKKYSIQFAEALGEVYRSLPKRPDMVAKADQLFERWLPIMEDKWGTDNVRVAGLLTEQARLYVMRGDGLIAASMRTHALQAAEKRKDKADRNWLEIESKLLQDEVSALRIDDGLRLLAYQARLVAVDEKLYGSSHSRVGTDRYWLEQWRGNLLYEPKMKDGSSAWEYDDVDHGDCVDIAAVAPSSGTALAYGHYKLINSCAYPITIAACVNVDRADGKPSENYDLQRDGAPCPGFGWGGAAMRAEETKNQRTWFEYRNIKAKFRVCREGWSIVGEDLEMIPLASSIDAKYACRRLRNAKEAPTRPGQSKKNSPGTPDKWSPVCSLSDPTDCRLDWTVR